MCSRCNAMSNEGGSKRFRRAVQWFCASDYTGSTPLSQTQHYRIRRGLRKKPCSRIRIRITSERIRQVSIRSSRRILHEPIESATRKHQNSSILDIFRIGYRRELSFKFYSETRSFCISTKQEHSASYLHVSYTYPNTTCTSLIGSLMLPTCLF